MLREELTAALNDHSVGSGFPFLRRLAARVVARTPHGRDTDAVDELVASFLADLVEHRDSIRTAALDDEALERAVRRRMRQLAAETGPQWLLVKSLREHVGAVIDDLPPPPDSRPTNLTEAGRFSSQKIALACAWFLARGGEARPERTRKSLAATLLDAYFREPAIGHELAPGEDTERPDDVVRRHRDAYALAEQLVDELGPTLSSVLMRRLAGEGMAEIARAEGCAVATVHARIEQAKRKMEPLLREYPSLVTAGMALREMAKWAVRVKRERSTA